MGTPALDTGLGQNGAWTRCGAWTHSISSFSLTRPSRHNLRGLDTDRAWTWKMQGLDTENDEIECVQAPHRVQAPFCPSPVSKAGVPPVTTLNYSLTSASVTKCNNPNPSLSKSRRWKGRDKPVKFYHPWKIILSLIPNFLGNFGLFLGILGILGLFWGYFGYFTSFVPMNRLRVIRFSTLTRSGCSKPPETISHTKTGSMKNISKKCEINEWVGRYCNVRVFNYDKINESLNS